MFRYKSVPKYLDPEPTMMVATVALGQVSCTFKRRQLLLQMIFQQTVPGLNDKLNGESLSKQYTFAVFLQLPNSTILVILS